jgi:hypothetical protein
MAPTIIDWSLPVGNGRFGVVQYTECTGSTSTTLFIHKPVVTLPISVDAIFAVTVFVLILICAYYRFRKRSDRSLHHDAAR